MKTKVFLVLGVILIIAGFLRFYHLSNTPPGLYPDEAMDGNNALQALHTGDFKVFYPPNNGVEGLYANIEAIVIAATGAHEPWVLRFPSAVFGFLTVLGVFFLARELFKKPSIALLSAFFLATSFWHVNFSRIGFRAITAPFFLVWALYFFLKAVDAQRMGSWITYSILGGAAFGLGFYSYISYRITPLLFLLAIPFFFRERNFWRTAGLFTIAAIIVALPLGLYFYQNPADFFGRTSQVSIMNSENPVGALLENTGKTIAMLDFAGDYNWRHNLAGRPQLFWPVGIAFWTGAVVALWHLVSKNRPGGDHELRAKEDFAYVLCFAWIGLAALPVVFSNEGIPHALRAILMIPPLMMLAGVGGVWLYGQAMRMLRKHHHILHMGTAIILSVLVLECAYTYFVAWGRDPNTAGAFTNDQVVLGRQIRELPRELPKYVLVRAGGVTVAQEDPWDPGRIQEIPVPAQTVMFMTDSYLPEQQKEKNIHYVLPEDEASIPIGSTVFFID